MNSKKITAVGIFGGLAWIISMFSFPIIPAFSFLKIDFSDMVILFATLVYGNAVGISVAAIRSFLSYLVTFGEMGYPIGDTTAFIASLCVVLPLAYAFKRYPNDSRRHFILGSIMIALLVVVMSLLNILIVIPLYTKVLGISVGNLRTYLLAGLIPFNVLKGIILFVLAKLSWRKIAPIIKGNKAN